MKNQLNTQGNHKTLCGIVVAVLVLSTLLQCGQAVAQSSQNPYALTLTVKCLSQNTTGNVFSPFSVIELSSNVSYNQAAQPNILVYFNIQGPTNKGAVTNISRIETTNSSGQAKFSFRLPVDGLNSAAFIGTWNASATIQSSSGAVSKNVNFTSQWPMEILDMSLFDLAGQGQTNFSRGDVVKVKFIVTSRAPELANITVDLLDYLGRSINQTVLGNQQVSNLTDFEAKIQVPASVEGSQVTVNTAIFAGTYQSVNIAAAANITAQFSINGAQTTTPPPTVVPTSTPTPSASPPPTIENSITLFSWLLAATGFFTFTALFMFLRRKPFPGLGTHTLPPPPPTALTESKPFGAPQKLVTPATVGQVQSVLDQSVLSSGDAGLVKAESALAHLNKISVTAKRIEELQKALRSEREQLDQEIVGLNKTIEAQENSIKSYFDALRGEIKKMQGTISDSAKPEEENGGENGDGEAQ